MVYLSVQNENNAAEEQCLSVVNVVQKYHLPCVMIETNGIGKFLPELLKKSLHKNGVSCAVLPKISRMNKAQRILEALDVRLANGSVFMHERIKNTPFLQEITEWNAEAKNMHDDGLDALSGCLLAEPVRIKGCWGPSSNLFNCQKSGCFKVLD